MKFSEIVDCYVTEDEQGREYRWSIEDGDNMVIIAPSTVMNFDHPNLAARVNAVFELKHYMVYGKKWTEKAGVEYFFVIPKDRIELVEQRGHSYVNIVINGAQFVLNVSGHTTNEGWEDIIRLQAHTCILKTKKQLKALAEAALSPEDVVKTNWSFDVDIKRTQRFFEMASQPVVLDKIKEGMWLMLAKDCSFRGSRGPFLISGVSRRRRRLYFEHLYVKYNQIDWRLTAEQNNIDIDIPESFNRVGIVNVVDKKSVA